MLVERYRGLVRYKARSYFILGADRDDVMQEGLIGLCKAIRDYDPSRQSSFRSFAELCVTRQLISAIKGGTRFKHQPLNSYVPLDGPSGADGTGDRALAEVLAVRGACNPAEIVISAWETASICDGLLHSLSPFEVDVLRLHLAGESYQQIATTLGRGVKAVDNALQRIKRKAMLQIEYCRSC